MDRQACHHRRSRRHDDAHDAGHRVAQRGVAFHWNVPVGGAGSAQSLRTGLSHAGERTRRTTLNVVSSNEAPLSRINIMNVLDLRAPSCRRDIVTVRSQDSARRTRAAMKSSEGWAIHFVPCSNAELPTGHSAGICQRQCSSYFSVDCSKPLSRCRETTSGGSNRSELPSQPCSSTERDVCRTRDAGASSPQPARRSGDTGVGGLEVVRHHSKVTGIV
jgi:hypothetical protein